MKNLFYKTGSIFVGFLLLTSVDPFPIIAQEVGFERIKAHDAYTRVSPAIKFDALTVTIDKYNKQDAKKDAAHEHFWPSLVNHVIYVNCLFINHDSSISGTYGAVVPVQVKCMDDDLVRHYLTNSKPLVNTKIDTVNTNISKQFPERNIQGHKITSSEQIESFSVYNPIDKLTRAKTDERNIEEHTTVNLTALTTRDNLHPRIRNNSRKQNTVLRRAYKDWPELRRYIAKNGYRSIGIDDLKKFERPNFDMERATIEVAIPGRQYDLNFSRILARRFGIDLPEFDRTRFQSRSSSRTRIVRNNNHHEVRTRSDSNTRNRDSSRNSVNERIERNKD